MERISLLGFGACAPDCDFRAGLPFPASEINRDAMPVMLRRRSSQATQMAFSAATQACAQAERSPATLPAVFASVAGEIQTTDQLCLELCKPDAMVSPSAFHNSVQNTAAGYWSIAQQCTQPATALAAGADTFAMALLEAWCQLACHGGELLLVCYDERWPNYLATERGQTAFACAMVLAAGTGPNVFLSLSRPYAVVGEDLIPATEADPLLAALPLLTLAAAGGKRQQLCLSIGSDWRVDVHGR
ncbi:MAG: beta-ketoacyl synthase chain length factor [Methylomonas sp.]|jgi:hypothetical protein|uniref:beta-ketoacyl synthase chain length factor n=1 Tax=Methylomonas sp. TaxID=418 RepID=UPI0025D83434|nr:beta-ketoacyl synthase chain length factor [Methylomonas sp.]MCK9608895.1 beta-ketoacyl synthase chain length factor [Methylomonas sp.]